MSPESVADLVDLEQELSSIQRGITQMERITPNEPTAKSSEDDPFGDSFTHFPVIILCYSRTQFFPFFSCILHFFTDIQFVATSGVV